MSDIPLDALDFPNDPVSNIMSDRLYRLISDQEAIARLIAIGETPAGAEARLREQDAWLSPDIIEQEPNPMRPTDL